MNIKDVISQEVKNIELYATKRPTYYKEEQEYRYEFDTLISLSNSYDVDLGVLTNVLMNRLHTKFEDTKILEYNNKDNIVNFIHLDESMKLNYKDYLNLPLTNIALIEKESISYNYLCFKITMINDEEVLVFIKLKSPIKVESNRFYIKEDLYNISFNKDGINVDNSPHFNVDLEMLSFIYFNNDFYVFDKELYQRYFKLEPYHVALAQDTIDQCNFIISDCDLIRNSNANLVNDYFSNVESMFEEFDAEAISNIIINLELDFQFSKVENKFIIKTAKELEDLILLASGCIGRNSLTNDIFKVNKPQNVREK